MSMELILAFVLAAIVLSVSPGAGAVNTMSNGLRYGVKRTLPAILGLQLGLAAQILIVGVGLGALLSSSALAFVVLKWLGVGYLIWLGIQKWREAPALLSAAQEQNGAGWQRFWSAALVNLLNPKSTIFLLAFLPQFLVPAEPQGPQFLIMGSILLSVDTLVMLGYASLAASLKGWFQNPAQQRLQNRVFGGMFVAAGSALASVSR